MTPPPPTVSRPNPEVRASAPRAAAGKQRLRRANASWLVLVLAPSLLASSCSDSFETTPGAVAAPPPRETLVAMARLEPESRVIDVASPESDIVTQMLVEEGQVVSKGDPLMVFAQHDLRMSEVEAARIALESVSLLPFEIEAQEARIRAIRADLEHGRNEVGSQESLSAKGFTAGVEHKNAMLRVRRGEEQLNEATALLKSLKGQMELERRKAENDLALAEAMLARTTLRAPIDGRILQLQVEEGERIGREAVLLGQTDGMFAVAEVHANDIHLVRRGQRATFSSPALPNPISGRVEEIGLMISKNDLFGERSPRGLRVVPVRVRLEDDALAANLTNLEGQIRIALVGPPQG